MWIKFQRTHIHLKVSLDCISLKTMKQLSRCLSEEQVRQMRHVSRTHRVALDWLFDRINLDLKIELNYVDTKNQLADMLTKESFTRDEWHHLLQLLNIMNFSTLSSQPFLSFKQEAECHNKEKSRKHFQ